MSSPDIFPADPAGRFVHHPGMKRPSKPRRRARPSRPAVPAPLRRPKEAASAYLEKFRARIREAREAKGLTQENVALTLGIGLDAYRSYENKAKLPPDLYEPLAFVLGISVDHLVTGRQRRS